MIRRWFDLLSSWAHELWLRYRLGHVLREALLVVVLSAVRSALSKEHVDEARLKSAVRTSLRQAFAKLRLPERYEAWILELVMAKLDELLALYGGENGRIMTALEHHLRKRLGLPD